MSWSQGSKNIWACVFCCCFFLRTTAADMMWIKCIQFTRWIFFSAVEGGLFSAFLGILNPVHLGMWNTSLLNDSDLYGQFPYKSQTWEQPSSVDTWPQLSVIGIIFLFPLLPLKSIVLAEKDTDVKMMIGSDKDVRLYCLHCKGCRRGKNKSEGNCGCGLEKPLQA